MVLAEIIPKTASTSSKPNIPPQTPTHDVGPIISLHHIPQLLDILSWTMPSKEESKPAEIKVDNENEKELKVRDSKLKFKIVNKTYIPSKSEQSIYALILIYLQLKQIYLQVYNCRILGELK